MKLWLKRILISAPILLLVFIVCVSSCMTFRQSDIKSLTKFKKHSVMGSVHHLEYMQKAIRYFESGADIEKQNLIVFVHGAPGSSQDMLNYLYDSTLLQHARMISLDRLGYGYSNYGHAETSIKQQAKLINFIVQDAEEPNVILVGHSFGGPIVAEAAVLNPKITSIMMIAPVNDPYNEKMFWVSYIGKWKLTRWLVSDAFKVATDEKFTHADELMKMEDDWGKLTVPVVHIHGHKDWLAPQSNVIWSEQKIPKEHLTIINDPELDHFIPFTNKNLVVQELILMLN